MSWSIPKIAGKPAAIRQTVAKAFDNAALYYKGKTEEGDVLAAKERVLLYLDEAKLLDGQGVTVEASGSRGGGWLSITVNCGTVMMPEGA